MKINSGIIVKTALMLLLCGIGFWLMDRMGVPPFAAAFVLIFFRGLLRAVFKIICFIVSAGLLIYLLSLIL